MQPDQNPSATPESNTQQTPITTSSVTANLSTPELPHAPEKLLTAHASAPAHKTSWGALIGIVIIVLVLIIGALYFWGAKLAKEDAQMSATEPSLEDTTVVPEDSQTGFIEDTETVQ